MQLTPREHQVLELIRSCKANKEIASALGISTRTVKFHVSNLLEKHGAKNRCELIAGVRLKGKEMEHLKKWWAVYGTIIVTAATYLMPALQALIAANPKASAVISGAAVILAKITKSPNS